MKFNFFINKKRIIGYLLFSILFLFIITASSRPVLAHDEAASGEVAIKILHTNDTHAHVDSHEVGYGKDTEEVGGFPRIISFVKSVREKNTNVLLLSAGDVFQGTLYFNFFKGLADYEFMNMAGYDVACFGNHEFDESPAWLLKAIEKLNCEKVNCNVVFGKSYPDASKKVKPYVIKEVNGLKIAIIGVITQNLFSLVSSKNLTDIELINPVEAIAPIVKELRPKVDMILVLSHMGLKEDLELAELVADIDLIIGGHSHSLLVSPVVLRTSRGQQVVINQAYEKDEFVGEVNMAFSRETKKWRLVDGKLNRMDKNIPKDKKASEMIEEYKKKIDGEVKSVIGENLKPLIGDKDSVRAGETNLGNLVADSLKNHAGTDIGIINGGSLRNSINPGPITIE
ncbi:MAG TPA: bifunctional UDP-sugar hydrolase/5'-nucleotidase, partial [Candidatus Wallbacteria bacterium]|nr:bifunctional UDP-sugar hydrolase/5'-nucleotidase [Candidatus Wallbacteria bacterium]